jgi:hypothetical protein
MPVNDFVRQVKFLQYTGSNGPEVAAWANSPILFDNGQRLILGVNIKDPSVEMDKNQWISETSGVFAHNDITNQWVPRSSLAGVDEVGTSDIASVAVPVLVAGSTTERTVTWARPFPNANYKVSFAPDASTIGRITPTVKAGTKTATGLTVVLSAPLAVSLAGVVHVLGTT